MASDALRQYERVLQALQAGTGEDLEALAQGLPGFPHEVDGFVGRRWIINAVDVGSVATVKWMVEKGVDLSFRDEEGRTPLHAALDRELPDKHEVLELLLKGGAAVNLKGVNDWTPAHMAAARDDVEALRLLVGHGADLAIRTSIDDYATPLEEARSLGKDKAASYLESTAQQRDAGEVHDGQRRRGPRS